MYKARLIYFLCISQNGGICMKKSSVAWSEAVGCVVIYAAAVWLHFAYQLYGGALGLVFGAVNESVWEHVKIYSIAYTGYAMLQMTWLRLPFRRYAVAKVLGLYLLMGGMIGFNYAYTFFTGRNILAVDILSSLVLVILVQLVTYRLETGSFRLEDYFAPAMLLLMLYYLMFFSFSVFPPKTGLFRDPTTGCYGAVGNILDDGR